MRGDPCLSIYHCGHQKNPLRSMLNVQYIFMHNVGKYRFTKLYTFPSVIKVFILWYQKSVFIKITTNLKVRKDLKYHKTAKPPWQQIWVFQNNFCLKVQVSSLATNTVNYFLEGTGLLCSSLRKCLPNIWVWVAIVCQLLSQVKILALEQGG